MLQTTTLDSSPVLCEYFSPAYRVATVSNRCQRMRPSNCHSWYYVALLPPLQQTSRRRGEGPFGRPELPVHTLDQSCVKVTDSIFTAALGCSAKGGFWCLTPRRLYREKKRTAVARLQQGVNRYRFKASDLKSISLVSLTPGQTGNANVLSKGVPYVHVPTYGGIGRDTSTKHLTPPRPQAKHYTTQTIRLRPSTERLHAAKSSFTTCHIYGPWQLVSVSCSSTRLLTTFRTAFSRLQHACHGYAHISPA
jgi:hypothetical protein